MKNLMQIHPQRVGDYFIMDKIFYQKYFPRQLTRINQCRMYTHSMVLSDITKTYGTSLQLGYIHGTKNVIVL